jgi:hypothetical protein
MQLPRVLHQPLTMQQQQHPKLLVPKDLQPTKRLLLGQCYESIDASWFVPLSWQNEVRGIGGLGTNHDSLMSRRE